MTLPILGLGLITLAVAFGLMLLASRDGRLAQTKGDALLRSWLSNEQGRQWEPGMKRSAPTPASAIVSDAARR